MIHIWHTRYITMKSVLLDFEEHVCFKEHTYIEINSWGTWMIISLWILYIVYLHNMCTNTLVLKWNSDQEHLRARGDEVLDIRRLRGQQMIYPLIYLKILQMTVMAIICQYYHGKEKSIYFSLKLDHFTISLYKTLYL